MTVVGVVYWQSTNIRGLARISLTGDQYNESFYLFYLDAKLQGSSIWQERWALHRNVVSGWKLSL